MDTGIFQHAGMVASKKSLAPDEYTAVALAIGYLVKYGVREETVCIKGNSVSSLKWAEMERVKGNLCTSAAICMLAPLTVGSIDIINSVHEWRYQYSMRPTIKRGTAVGAWLPVDGNGRQQRSLCNLAINHVDLSKFCAFFLSVQNLVQTLED